MIGRDLSQCFATEGWGSKINALVLKELFAGHILIARFIILCVRGSFAWAARFRRLARDYERLDTTLKNSTCSPSPASCSLTSPLLSNEVLDRL